MLAWQSSRVLNLSRRSPLVGKSILSAVWWMHHIFYISIQKKAILFLICSQRLAYLLTQASFGLYCFYAFSTRLHLGSAGSPEVSSHHSMSDRHGSIFLRGLPSWQVWASTSVCVCTHMQGKTPVNSHSCAAVTAGAEWEILYRKHICNKFPVHFPSVCGWHHLTIDRGPNELEERRCLGCPCLRPIGS